MDDMEASCSNISPKKTRASFDANYDRKRPQCRYCYLYQEDNSEPICKSMSDGEKLKEMAKEAQNWVVYARINEAFDATAADIHYHKPATANLQMKPGLLGPKNWRLKLQCHHMTPLSWPS
jgi:hypothetical protein